MPRILTRMLRLLLAGAALPACSSGDAMMAMMTSYCDIPNEQLDPNPHPDNDPSPPIDCNFKKGAAFGSVCRHSGGNWKHNWAADYWENQLYPDTGPHAGGTQDDYGYGCDAEFTTASKVLMDGYIKKGTEKPITFETKAANYEQIQASPSCPDSLKASILEDIENQFKKSAMKEEPIAQRCGFRYQMVFTDRTLYSKALAYFANDHFIELEICDGCRNPPPLPSDYGVKPMDVPATGTAFTRFWLDSEGHLQSKQFEAASE